LINLTQPKSDYWLFGPPGNRRWRSILSCPRFRYCEYSLRTSGSALLPRMSAAALGSVWYYRPRRYRPGWGGPGTNRSKPKADSCRARAKEIRPYVSKALSHSSADLL